MAGLRVRLSESTNPRFIYVSPTNVVHLMVPIISADDIGIGLDNTCQSVAALQQFFGLRHDSNQLRDSALHKLQDYQTELQNDIRTLTQYGQDASLVSSRLQQVEHYIDLLRRIKNYPLNQNLDTLQGCFPSYPPAFQHLLRKTDSNLYAMRLKPTDEDRLLRADFPIFSVNRTNSQGRTVFYNALARVYRGITRYNLKTSKEQFINRVLDRIPVNQPSTVGNLKAQVQQVMEAQYQQYSNENVFSLARVNEALGYVYEDEDPIATAQALKEMISVILNSVVKLNLTKESVFNTLSSTHPDNRTEKLSIMTQFLLGEINIYAQSHGILRNRANLAQCLDNNEALANQYAQAVKTAIENGASVENSICSFVHAYPESVCNLCSVFGSARTHAPSALKNMESGS